MKMNPYLLFEGDCEEAFKTYAKVLGGEIVAMIQAEGSPASPAGRKTGARRSSTPACFSMAWRW